MDIVTFESNEVPIIKGEVANFLYTHLEEFGDPIEDIENCLDYVNDRGGHVITAKEKEDIFGAVIINKTGMKGYIPENILVYIAVDKKARGHGLGKKLMKRAIEITTGDIALHVEKDNPARFLYEKVGFTNPYLEMRYKKSS